MFFGREQLGTHLKTDSDSNLRGCERGDSAKAKASATDDVIRFERCARSKPALTTFAVEPPTKTAGIDQGVADNPPEESIIMEVFADKSIERLFSEIETELEAAISEIQKYSKKKEELESLDEVNQFFVANWHQLGRDTTPTLQQQQ